MLSKLYLNPMKEGKDYVKVRQEHINIKIKSSKSLPYVLTRDIISKRPPKVTFMFIKIFK